MKRIIGLFVLSGIATACSVEDASDRGPISKQEAAERAEVSGKADGWDYCAQFGWYDDGICDWFCLSPDPDCGGGGAGSCESVGGECLSSPIDITFAADCEGEYGLVTSDGECGAFNQTCCIGGGGDGGDGGGDGGGDAGDGGGEPCGPNTCDAGMVCCNESCGICTEPGGFCTQQLCGPDDGGDGGDAGDGGGDPGTCADVGGQCLSSPIDVTFAADCEGDFGLSTSDADCPFFNQSCCL